MVPWWKRLLFSLASILAAVVVCLGCQIVVGAVFMRRAAIIHSSAVVPAVEATLVLCLIGWVASAPVVLLIRNVRGLRFWLDLVLGSSFGPLMLLAVVARGIVLAPHSSNERWTRPELWLLVSLAFSIWGMTSLFHWSLLRRARAKATAGPSTHSARSG